MSAVAPVPVSKPVEPVAAQVTAHESAALQLAKSAQRKRVKKLLRGLALWVFLPTLLSGVYYGLIAPDEYESAAVVVLRGEGDAGRRGVLLSEFLQSRDALAQLEASYHIAEQFQRASGGAGEFSAGVGSEQRYRNYLARTSVQLDQRSGVVRVRARAFAGESARVFAQALLDVGAHFLTDVEGDTAHAPFTVVARPRAPSDSTYPHRGYAILTTFFACMAVFAIGSLLIAAVREHAHF